MDQYRFNGKVLTKKTIKETRQHFADIEQECINAVLSGDITVNDKYKYIDDCKKSKDRYLNGKHKITLTFLQRAYYLQEGDSIALLP